MVNGPLVVTKFTRNTSGAVTGFAAAGADSSVLAVSFVGLLEEQALNSANRAQAGISFFIWRHANSLQSRHPRQVAHPAHAPVPSPASPAPPPAPPPPAGLRTAAHRAPAAASAPRGSAP